MSRLQNTSTFTLERDEVGEVVMEDGRSRCPFNPEYKSTAIIVGRYKYSFFSPPCVTFGLQRAKCYYEKLLSAKDTENKLRGVRSHFVPVMSCHVWLQQSL